MQKYKSSFKNESVSNLTVSNLQSCIRLNDFDLVGDGTHCCSFTMMGLFSFRHWSINQTIEFWLEFLENRLNLKVDYVTIHPNKTEWSEYYSTKKIIIDPNCEWTDGEIGGYCTEFYINNIEIGNIVNPLNTCIDVGFGLERIDRIINNIPILSRLDEMILTYHKLIKSGIVPDKNKHGYVLRKIIREIIILNGTIDDLIFINELNRYKKMYEKYNSLKVKNFDKSKEWWYSTHGIDLDLV